MATKKKTVKKKSQAKSIAAKGKPAVRKTAAKAPSAKAKPAATGRPRGRPPGSKSAKRAEPEGKQAKVKVPKVSPPPPPKPVVRGLKLKPRLPPAKIPPAPPKPAKAVVFDAGTLDQIKQGLLSEQKDLLEEKRDLESMFDPAQVEASGEAGYDDDFSEAGAATFEREKELSLVANINDLLEKVDKALRKVDDGTYGRCESCGQPISAERLKALPHALLCIQCKTAQERR